MDALLQDLRHVVRSARSNPWFSCFAVLILALGIGGTTAIFTVVDGVLLRPLPYRDPAQLVVVREVIPKLSRVYPSLAANIRHVVDWRAQSHSFTQIAAAQGTTLNLTGVGDPEQLRVARVSANIFTTLGVGPVLGRGFMDEEDQPGRDRVVVLSHGLWQRRFQSDPTWVGKPITLNGHPYLVVGILPPTLVFPKHDELGPMTDLGARVDLFTPLGIELGDVSPLGEFNFGAIARLEPGVTLETAEADLNAIQRNIGRSLPSSVELLASVHPLQSQMVRDVGGALWLLLGAVVVVLLISCANLANLLLVRAATRQREWAIHAALGASGVRLARQIVLEGLLLAFVGGVLGLLIASGVVTLVVSQSVATLPRLNEVRVDARVFVFVSALSVLTGVLLSALPALRLMRTGPQEALVSAANQRLTEGARGRRTRNVLVGAEVGLCTTLLIVTGLLLVSMFRLVQTDRGFDVARILAADIALPSTSYQTAAQRRDFFRRVLDNASNVAGVRAAGVISALPLRGESWVDVVTPEGDQRSAMERPVANYRFASPSYFQTLQITLRAGRLFNDADGDRPVAVISEGAAQRVWPGGSAVGRRFRRGNQPVSYEIVGVVADVRTVGVDRLPPSMVYVPYWGEGNDGLGPPAEMSLAVSTIGDPRSVLTSVRTRIRDVDPTIPLGVVTTMEDVLSASMAGRRLQLMLLIGFAACALLIAGLGIYGVSAYAAARRTKEIALRLALGASKGQIQRLVLKQAGVPIVIGLVAGVGVALALGRVMRAMLFDVSGQNPLVIGAVVVVIGLLTMAATHVPTRRACAVDPLAALRSQ